VTTATRSSLLTTAAALLIGLSAAPAHAGPIVDAAATALANDPVYVDPEAEKAIGAADERRIEREIETNGHGPMYIAILPAAAVREAGGDATGVVDEIHGKLGRRGVYAVVAGNHFRAESTDLGRGEAGDLAREAIDAHRADGVAATLVDFVDRVGEARTNGGSDGGGSGGGFGPTPIVPLAGRNAGPAPIVQW
jgi:hypothetical protein